MLSDSVQDWLNLRTTPLQEANYMVHNLARHVFVSNSTFSWGNDPPDFIIPAVMIDVSLFKCSVKNILILWDGGSMK